MTIPPAVAEFRANIEENFRITLCAPVVRAAIEGLPRDVLLEIYSLGFTAGSTWQAERDADLMAALEEAAASPDVTDTEQAAQG